MIFPTETGQTPNGMTITMCTKPCTGYQCIQKGCSFSQWGGHWWGVHNVDCPECVEISNWRGNHGIDNNYKHSHIGPDEWDKPISYPLEEDVPEDVMNEARNKLLALAKELS